VELKAFKTSAIRNLTSTGADLDGIEAEQDVTLRSAGRAILDAGADIDMIGHAKDEAKRVLANRAKLSDEKVPELNNYIDDAVKQLGGAVLSVGNKNTEAMTGIVNHMHKWVAEVDGLRKIGESKQIDHQQSLERVEKLQHGSGEKQKQWVAENIQNAEMVDYRAAELLHWAQRFAVSDHFFKDIVRQKLESLDAGISEEVWDAVNKAHGTVLSEKGQRFAAHTKFESEVGGEKAHLEDVVSQVHQNALDILARVRNDMLVCLAPDRIALSV